MFVDSWKLQIISSLGRYMRAYGVINYIYYISKIHMLYIIKLAFSSVCEVEFPISSSLLLGLIF